MLVEGWLRGKPLSMKGVICNSSLGYSKGTPRLTDREVIDMANANQGNRSGNAFGR